MLINKFRISLVIYYCIYCSICIYAIPLNITADNLVIDNVNNTADFTGEVVLYFEDMTLKTSNVKLYYIKSINNSLSLANNIKNIYKIFIPHKLIATRKCDRGTIVANSAKYYFNDTRLLLQGEVFISKNNNMIKTDTLLYHTKFKAINDKISD